MSPIVIEVYCNVENFHLSINAMGMHSTKYMKERTIHECTYVTQALTIFN